MDQTITDEKMDYWSIGIIFYVMINRKVPFDYTEVNDEEEFSVILKKTKLCVFEVSYN